MDDVEKLPCPFCGSLKNRVCVSEKKPHDYWVECYECCACGPLKDLPADAKSAWRSRKTAKRF